MGMTPSVRPGCSDCTIPKQVPWRTAIFRHAEVVLGEDPGADKARGLPPPGGLDLRARQDLPGERPVGAGAPAAVPRGQPAPRHGPGGPAPAADLPPGAGGAPA